MFYVNVTSLLLWERVIYEINIIIIIYIIYNVIIIYIYYNNNITNDAHKIMMAVYMQMDVICL